jgi:hypothetical protein
MAKNVRTQEIGMDAGSLRVHCEPFCESSGATQPRVWQSMTNENSPIACMRGAVILEVARKGMTHGIQEWQVRDNTSLRPPNPEYPRRPVDVIEC